MKKRRIVDGFKPGSSAIDRVKNPESAHVSTHFFQATSTQNSFSASATSPRVAQ